MRCDAASNGLHFPLLFLLAAGLLMGLYNAMPSFVIEDGIVRYFAVVPGAAVLDWLLPDYHVMTDNTRIVSSVISLNVLRGCEGTETLLLLYAAIIALLRPLAQTLLGILVGTVLVFILNQLRIVGLFLVVAHHKAWFELIHGFLAPMLIIVTVGVFFLYWRNLTQVADAPPH